MMKTAERTRQVSGAAALSFTGQDFSRVHPDRGGRFSPNLYAFLTAKCNRGLAARARVYADAKNALWIGYFDDLGMFVGSRLSLVLCYGAKQQPTCPVNLGPLAEVIDFWQRYEQVGRCAIDRDHVVAYIADNTRWTYSADGTERSCRWCAAATQKLFTELVTHERETWRAAAA